MKIAFVLSCLRAGGLEMQTIKLANSLVDTPGNEVHLIILNDDKTLEYMLKPDICREYADFGGFYDSMGVQRLKDIFSSRKFDVIFAEEMYAGYNCRKALKNSGAESELVLVLHTTILPNFKERLKNLYYKRMANQFRWRIFVSQNQLDYWVTKYGISRENSLLIHNGIDTNHFNCSEDIDSAAHEFRSRNGIGKEDFVIIKCGSLIKPKNDMLLLKAANRIMKEDGTSIKVILVGDGSERPAIEAYIRENGMEGKVFLTGIQKDVRTFIASADAGTLPSYATETFSLAALEQMAMGKPVILSDIGGASEMVLESRNGYLFPNNDLEEYIAKLRRLIAGKSTGELAKMGDEARKLVLERFSHETMVHRYMNFIKNRMV